MPIKCFEFYCYVLSRWVSSKMYIYTYVCIFVCTYITFTALFANHSNLFAYYLSYILTLMRSQAITKSSNYL